MRLGLVVGMGFLLSLERTGKDHHWSRSDRGREATRHDAFVAWPPKVDLRSVPTIAPAITALLRYEATSPARRGPALPRGLAASASGGRSRLAVEVSRVV